MGQLLYYFALKTFMYEFYNHLLTKTSNTTGTYNVGSNQSLLSWLSQGQNSIQTKKHGAKMIASNIFTSNEKFVTPFCVIKKEDMIWPYI